MSTTPDLSKSLDDIIGAKPRVSGRNRRRSGQKKSAGVTKGSATSSKKDVSKLKDASSKKSPKQQAKKAKADDPFHQAVKITISNFPVDITEPKLKEYLHNDIGAVKSCEGVYGRNGKPTGKFTVEFRDEGKALAAFNKLNGMPMDGGKKILAVEIHTDPTRKSLASRLGSITPAKENQQKQAPKKADQKKKKATSKKAAPKKRTAPKSAEELDAEMDEYNNQKDIISV